MSWNIRLIAYAGDTINATSLKVDVYDRIIAIVTFVIECIIQVVMVILEIRTR